MTIKNKILSVFLAVLMFTSVFTAFPPMEVWAASGYAPKVSYVTPEVGDDYIVLKGTVYDNGGVDITKYGFGYSINNRTSYDEWYIQEKNIAENKTFSYRIDGLKIGDVVSYVIFAENQYGGNNSYGEKTIKYQVKVSVEDIAFDANGGQSSFKIEAKGGYTISTSNTWIKVDSTGGSSNATITVTCSKNTSNSYRAGYINVRNTSSGETHVIDIRQEGKIDNLDISEDSFEFDANGGSDVFEVYAVGAYTLSVNCLWFSVTPTSASGDNTITIKCNKNTTAYDRDGIITIVHTATNEKVYIDVFQSGQEESEKLDKPNITSPSNGTTFASTTPITFNWNNVDKADYYSYEVYKIHDGKHSFVTWNDIRTNTVTLDRNLFESGYTYSFEVSACSDDNHYQDSSWAYIEFSVENNVGPIFSALETVSCDWATPFVPNIKVTQGNSPLTKVTVALYTSEKGTDGILYFTKTFTNGQSSIDLSSIMSSNKIVWGEPLSSVSSGSVFDTNTLGEQAYIYIWVVDGNGTYTFGQYLNFFNKPAVSDIIGDINGDSAITNKDRFLLNRYLANMSGYTNINKTVADINGDGNVNSDDAVILERHLFGWIGYENLDAFHNTTTVPPTNVPKWDMSFSSNAVTIELFLKEGTLEKNKNYLFIAENSKGLHYTGILEAGQTSASFSVKAMQMPRGEMYSYYIIPEGVVLAGNKDTYCIGKSVVPLFNGNMITSVKSGDRTIAKNGYVFVGDGLTINWDGSFGVDNFKLVVTLNGSEIYNKTFNHDGPGTVTISADKISAKGPGTLIISGYVEPSLASGLTTAVSVWTGNVVETEKTTDTQVDPVDLLNKDALALYMKNEDLAYLKLETYYYWQAFADELNSGRYWESYRSDISNIVNGILSSPTTMVTNLDSKALLKQAIKTKLLEKLESEENLKSGIQNDVENTINDVGVGTNIKGQIDALLELKSLYKLGDSVSDSDLLGIIKKIDLRSFNGSATSEYMDIFNDMVVFYNGNSYKIKDIFNVANDDTAEFLKNTVKEIKNAKSADQLNYVKNIKNTKIINTAKFKSAFNVDRWDLVGVAANGFVFAADMYSLYFLNEKFDKIEEELYDIEGGSSGVFKEAISEVINELRREYIEQFANEYIVFATKTTSDLAWGKLVSFLAKKNPYAFLTVASNGIMTCLANTDAVNKGELTLPCIAAAMNDTISQIEYTYSLFMLNPSNELYYELKSLFVTYRFQVELGAEVYMNLNMADHNSFLKRFVRFINPFDKEDKMPETIQSCYDQDIKKLNYVLTWFGFI
ncbi:MAG: hypothetical protein IKC63_03730 [Clostridia bacterium]|nr:hypothetical protein [Clostridia bacterium]